MMCSSVADSVQLQMISRLQQYCGQRCTHCKADKRQLTCGKLGEVAAVSLAQAAHMELTLTLVTQDHGAVAEVAQGKVWPPTDVATPSIMIQIMDDISTPMKTSQFAHTELALPSAVF